MLSRRRPPLRRSLLDVVPVAAWIIDAGDQVLSESGLADDVAAHGESVVFLSQARLLPRVDWASSFATGVAGARAGRASVLQVGEWRVRFAPLPPDPVDIFGHTRNAVCISIDGPPVDSLAVRKAIRERYSLTAAEAITAELIAAGCSIADISSRLHRSRETVRTHVKRLFQKTGAGTQRKLGRLLRSEVLSTRLPNGADSVPTSRQASTDVSSSSRNTSGGGGR